MSHPLLVLVLVVGDDSRARIIQDGRRGADLRCPPLGSYLEGENKNENEDDCSLFEARTAIGGVAS
jgi:hypothetical protein